MSIKGKNSRKAMALSIMLILAIACQSQQTRFNYPETRKSPKSETYHGVKLTDDYAWLDQVQAEEVMTWARAQDNALKTYVQTLPQYEALKTKLTELTRISGRLVLPTQAAGKYFYHKADEQGGWSLYERAGGQGALKKLDLPFNSRAAFFFLPSPDASHIALGMARPGRNFDWKVLNVASGELSETTLTGTAMGNTRLAWSANSKGFYYMSSNKADENGRRTELRLKYHALGTGYEQDKEVYTPESDGSRIHLDVTTEGKYLIIAERQGAATAAKLKYLDIRKSGNTVKSLVDKAEGSYVFMGNQNDVLYFQTDLGASNGKIVTVDISKPTKLWKELVPEANEPMMGFQSAGGTLLPLMAGNRLVVPSQKDLKISLKIYDLKGQLKTSAALPSGGLYFNSNGLNALSGSKDGDKILTEFIGITEPNTVFSIDVNNGEVKAFDRAGVSFNADEYQSEIVFAKSKDGARVPISLTYKKGLKRDKKNPVMMQVYGAIAFTNYPYFQGDYMGWLDMGGIHAVAHIRGGGAYGADWHQQGIARNKQNGIDDYIAAIEWMIDNDYSRPDRMVINGVSAGTIPVGAVMTQRPDLVGAVVSHYGMLDMIGYSEKFQNDQNHGYMIPEIGKASDAADFKAIHAYSPYQKLKKGTKYPPVLALTSDGDAPLNADSYKYIARLQQNTRSKSPMMLQMAWGSGHSAFGSQQHAPVQTFTDELAFLILAMKLDVSDWLD